MSDLYEPLIGGVSGLTYLKGRKYRPIPEYGQVYYGPMSWFGQFGYGDYDHELAKYRWSDNADNARNASGLSQQTPGIAYMSKETIRHWFKLTFPNDVTVIVRQVDLGPALWTNKIIDVNAPLAEMVGYSPRTFPTGHNILFQYIGQDEPDGAIKTFREL